MRSAEVSLLTRLNGYLDLWAIASRSVFHPWVFEPSENLKSFQTESAKSLKRRELQWVQTRLRDRHRSYLDQLESSQCAINWPCQTVLRGGNNAPKEKNCRRSSTASADVHSNADHNLGVYQGVISKSYVSKLIYSVRRFNRLDYNWNLSVWNNLPVIYRRLHGIQISFKGSTARHHNARRNSTSGSMCAMTPSCTTDSEQTI